MTGLSPAPDKKLLSLLPTYRCTAACRSCGTLSSPRALEELPAETILDVISQAIAAHYGGLVMTGGEATLIGETLFTALSTAAAAGLGTRLVTNGWWAPDRDSAEAYVHRLVSADLRELNLSTGNEHARFVPVGSVGLAAAAGVAAGLPVLIMLEETKKQAVTREALTDAIKSVTTDEIARQIQIVASPWMPLSGWKVGSYREGSVVTRSNLAARGGCDSVLRTTTVGADGRIFACCGLGVRLIPELCLGNIQHMTLQEADEIAAQDVLKRWLHLEGPEKILAWAAEQNSSIEWEGMYAHRCQSCIRMYKDPEVRKTIASCYTVKVPDIIVGDWLQRFYQPDFPVAEPSQPVLAGPAGIAGHDAQNDPRPQPSPCAATISPENGFGLFDAPRMDGADQGDTHAQAGSQHPAGALRP